MMAQPRRINLDEQARIGSLTTDIIADGAITTTKIATGAIDDTLLQPGSITADKLDSSIFGLGVVPNGTTNAIDINVDNLSLEISSDILQVKDGGIITSKLNIDNNLIFNNREALSFRIENLASDPTPGNVGRLIFRTDLLQLKVDDGTSFNSIGSGSGGHIIEDEGTPLTQQAVLNFVGSGVTVTDSGGKTEVSIPGGGGSLQAEETLVTVTNPTLDKTIILANTPISKSEFVFLNGLELRRGTSNDYTISGNTVTLTTGVTLVIGDELLVKYNF